MEIKSHMKLVWVRLKQLCMILLLSLLYQAQKIDILQRRSIIIEKLSKAMPYNRSETKLNLFACFLRVLFSGLREYGGVDCVGRQNFARFLQSGSNTL